MFQTNHARPNTTKHPSRLTPAGMAWRNLYTRPGRTLLTLLGIALGVAAILATDITNRNVAYTLNGLFIRTLGNAELQVLPLANELTIKESVLESVRRVPGVSLAVPVIRTDTVLSGTLDEGQPVSDANGNIEIGKSVQVEGIDLLLEPDMRVYTVAAGRFPTLGEYGALVPQAFAEQNELILGGELLLFGPNGDESLEVTGLLADEGAAMINDRAILPLTVISGGQHYPSDVTVRAAFASVTPSAEFMDGETIAASLGNPRVVNVVLLGALSALLERDQEPGLDLEAQSWMKVIAERVPSGQVELNWIAFEAGRDAIKDKMRILQT